MSQDEQIVARERETDTLQAARELGKATAAKIAKRAGYPDDAGHLELLQRLEQAGQLECLGQEWRYLGPRGR